MQFAFSRLPAKARQLVVERALTRALTRCITSVSAVEGSVPPLGFSALTKTWPDLHYPRPTDAGLTLGIKAVGTDLSAVRDAELGCFHQKPLPNAHVPFTSKEGRALFRESLATGHAESFFFLSEQFRTQDEPTYCGLSTLAMVLNSLRIDPMRTWKGVWRWFNEQNLGCCGANRVREEGLTFDMFMRMAQCNGANAVAHRAPAMGGEEEHAAFAETFRAAVKAVTSSSDREFIVVSYSRASLGQTGDGHFSPIGGYHEESDSVLVMDVARFKYPMHWVPLTDMTHAMAGVDLATSQSRGFMRLRAHPPIHDPRHMLKPLHVPHIPRAAGRQLSGALTKALTVLPPSANHAAPAAWAARAMCRWLQAASFAEPQVLRRLFEVGDAVAFQEVTRRLNDIPIYKELRGAYASLLELGLAEDFPQLRFTDRSFLAASASRLSNHELNLNTCGELWVLLLLLLPQHIRGAVADELGEASLSLDVVKRVRCPWALPLEALRETLADTLQPLHHQTCSQKPGRSAILKEDRQPNRYFSLSDI